ncbi:MAG: HPr(Ser) kinase/phosphatase [Betaproteobacteria bacterium]|nr:HPr(Ser) kinase/phosphatase [Betaproteobacteria bacterium]
MTTTVRKLLDQPMLGLAVVAGKDGLDRLITTAELNRPALELTGYFSEFRSERIQIFGQGELAYLATHAHGRTALDALSEILSHEDVPCVVVTNGNTPPAVMCERAEAAGIPVLTCPHSTTKLYKRLWEHLEPHFAPCTDVHGVLLEIHDLGVLIQGHSSIGKSEVALDLLRRGDSHLVADDMVSIKCLNDSILIGCGSNLLPFHMEARGLGVIDVNRLFGAAAVRPDKRISLVITLMDWQDTIEYDRIGLTEETVSILDVRVPHIMLPVKPGRSTATLIEIAALNQKLKNMGVNTAREVVKRLDEVLGDPLAGKEDEA